MITFRPRYDLAIKLTLLLPLLFFAMGLAIGLLEIYTKGKYSPLLYLYLLPLAVYFFLLSRLVRQIRFSDKMFVDRFLSPPQKVEYSDISYISAAIHLEQGQRIPLDHVRNLDTFGKLLLDVLIKEGQVNPDGGVFDLYIEETKAAIMHDPEVTDPDLHWCSYRLEPISSETDKILRDREVWEQPKFTIKSKKGITLPEDIFTITSGYGEFCKKESDRVSFKSLGPPYPESLFVFLEKDSLIN